MRKVVLTIAGKFSHDYDNITAAMVRGFFVPVASRRGGIKMTRGEFATLAAYVATIDAAIAPLEMTLVTGDTRVIVTPA